MKTAMQELMDYLNEDEFSGICEIRDKVEELFKKEKEQITKAYNSAIPFKFGEEYYNQKYNQNK